MIVVTQEGIHSGLASKYNRKEMYPVLHFTFDLLVKNYLVHVYMDNPKLKHLSDCQKYFKTSHNID